MVLFSNLTSNIYMKNKVLLFSHFFILVFLIHFFSSADAQNRNELNSGWKCIRASSLDAGGTEISRRSFPTEAWLPATVPGTVLTTLLNNHLVKDPFYGMNNELIPDIYDSGNQYYTYWFINDFEEERPSGEEEIWMHLRGVNYRCNVFLNGEKLNEAPHQGMFLRQTYRVTDFLAMEGKNRLAVIVYPPDPPGNPNGGQGGDGVIGRSVTHQYVAGWDWIQPVRDRNTGIWDKVWIERTGSINIKNPHVVTLVPGMRSPGNKEEEPAIIKVSAELENPTGEDVTGTLKYRLADQTHSLEVIIPGNSTFTVHFPDFTLIEPRLWWPNGYGPQNLYDLSLEFTTTENILADRENLRIGIRQINAEWNPFTRSMEIHVNGQKVFIKGGNWIISDAMLRFSPERYDAEIRFHRDMNLNMIRIWGGAIMERPEFYHACDKYGILVWQDFGMSGDCNGRWLDPRKKEDQWERRKYPDDHELFIHTAIDQVKMIRNHPALALWCGGNEIGPPEDIVTVLKDTLRSELDGTRLFIESSTSGEMYYNFKGGVGDGPYGIQDQAVFWEDRSFPFNPELGSIGTGDYQSLIRFIPDTSMIVPGHYQSGEQDDNRRWRNIEPVWRYHKYLGYSDFIEKYGNPTNVKDFAKIAQLVNYDQYRALVEGFSSHMWEWYTGFLIWKTQNPWTSLRGQMYDCYLDPNGGLYGLHHGSEPLHIMFNPVTQTIMVVNNTFQFYRDVMVVVHTYDQDGNITRLYQQLHDIEPVTVKNCQAIGRGLNALKAKKGIFLSMKLLKSENEILAENLYWLPDSTGNYPFLREIPGTTIQAHAVRNGNQRIDLELNNGKDSPLAFFMRISLIDRETKERVLPVFYSDNYLSLEPGRTKKISLEYPAGVDLSNKTVHLEGWNVEELEIVIR
jgi:hypothetical protein